MKLFKKIYYVALALAFILVFSFTVADMQGGKGRDFNTDEAVGYMNLLAGGTSAHSIYNVVSGTTKETDKVAEKITGKLTDFGLAYGEGLTDKGEKQAAGNSDETVKFGVDSAGKRVPTVYVQKMNYNLEDYYKQVGINEYTGKDDDGNDIEVLEAAFPLTLGNIYAAFPGTKGDDAGTVLIMAHYDSVPMSPGAYDDMASVSAMLTVIHGMMDGGASYENNIIFIFTDGEEFGMYGAKMAKDFAGFGGAVKNAGFIANFESRGTGGTSIMFETNANNYNVIKNYAKISNSIYTNSIANYVYSVMPNNTDFSVFQSDESSVAGVNFANVGEGENYHTQNDNITQATSKAGRAFISQHGDIMGRIVRHFGNAGLADLTATSNAVYFSYLNIAVIYYPLIVAFVFAGIILALIGAVIGVNLKKKAFSFKKLGLGVAAQVIALVASIGLMFGVYYLFALLAAWAGKADIHTIAQIKFSSPALMMGALGFTAIIAAAAYTVCMRLFKIKAGSVVNGSILLLCVAAAVIGFVLPEISFVLMWVALLEAVVWLLTVLFKDKFKAKYGCPMEKLFLPLIPVILCMPMTLSVIMLAGEALGAWMYPLICGIAVLTLGMIAPYFSSLTPVMTKAVSKLRPITFRQQIVSSGEEKQVKAHTSKNVSKYKGQKAPKDGKTVTDSSGKRYIYTQRPWKYSNWRGLTALAFVMFVFVLCFSVFGGNQAMAVSGSYGANAGAFEQGALTYVIDKQGTNYWMVADLDAYSYMKRNLDGYKYDKDKEAYVKTVSEKQFFGYCDAEFTRSSSANRNRYTITPAINKVSTSSNVLTRYTITIDNSSRILKTVLISSTSSQTIDVSGNDKIVLKLTGNVNITFTTADGTDYAGTLQYEEDIIGLADRKFETAKAEELDYGANNEYNEWKDIKDMSSGNGGFRLAVKYITQFTCGG